MYYKNNNNNKNQILFSANDFINIRATSYYQPCVIKKNPENKAYAFNFYPYSHFIWKDAKIKLKKEKKTKEIGKKER